MLTLKPPKKKFEKIRKFVSFFFLKKNEDKSSTTKTLFIVNSAENVKTLFCSKNLVKETF